VRRHPALFDLWELSVTSFTAIFVAGGPTIFLARRQAAKVAQLCYGSFDLKTRWSAAWRLTT
jgi:hypothetical protein